MIFFAKYMLLKIFSKRVLLIVASAGLVLFVVVFFFIFISKNSMQGSSVVLVENAVAQSNQEQIIQEEFSVGLPVRLQIPAIDVDAAVISVGITSDGEMDVPKNPADVAWYSPGSRPGENGSAVIAGHYDQKNNVSAVFTNLHSLKKGDTIVVEDEEGVTTTFVVRDIMVYDKDRDATDVFFSRDGNAHLNLVTCTGVWDKSEKSYSERIIVFSDKK
ncbi:MAG: class F sortase [Candidatus Magasanikbacteria bacterium CG10_big_fil_rev_8_21_14_0_10_42_10]|uniref:Class F sortase n=2 Tax=Candidatus Magasanikiibacteriota TaxID=1752731 RepID=A0A2H0TXH2_9BACT|nr:MAG: class F sortase [Candidatus Magasanikbacteria bacterium CG10_big_fil_rev_8_21_14_0_10_42_10]PIZ94316.1 MAG: class F sortase [Candidatus Magasanikbacteria bacterium CG_4_10_14_0_2_um_filter_41_10]